jgi:hypothetical protein
MPEVGRLVAVEQLAHSRDDALDGTGLTHGLSLVDRARRGRGGA